MTHSLIITVKKALILSVLSGSIVSTLPTKTIAQISDCVAADWTALKTEIDKRNNSVKTSLEEMISQVKNKNITEADINSQKQIEAIDSLLSCLNSPQLPATLSPQKDQAIKLLTDFKNNILNRAKEGLVNNNDDTFDNQDNFYSLKRNLKLEEDEAQIPTIGDTFIAAFEGAIGTFTNDVSSQISQLPETLPPPTPDPAQTSNNNTEENQSPESGRSQANSLRLLAAILLLIAIPVVIFKVRSDRSNHSHRRRSRQSSKILDTLQREFHLPLLSSKGKWKPEAAQDLPPEEIDERSEIGYLKQKIDNLERQMEKTNRSIISIQAQLKEITLGQKSLPSQQTTTHSGASWQSNAPHTLSTQPYDKPQTESLFVNSVSPDPSVSMSPIDQLIQTYNTSPGNLQGVGVSETQESFNQRRSGLNVPVMVTQASNPSLYIVQDSYLVPRPGSKVTSHMLNTIEAVFDCYNFRSGAPFQLIEPAIVSPLSNNQWQLNQKGKLRFS